jgi:hypothetical protein
VGHVGVEQDNIHLSKNRVDGRAYHDFGHIGCDPECNVSNL